MGGIGKSQVAIGFLRNTDMVRAVTLKTQRNTKKHTWTHIPSPSQTFLEPAMISRGRHGMA